MSKNKRTSSVQGSGLSAPGREVAPTSPDSRSEGTFPATLKSHKWVVAVVLFISIGALGAGLKHLNESAKTEMKLAAKDRSLISSINPFIPSTLPSPTPQLSKEYIYAGSRLLAVEDKNAAAVPPADLAIWRPGTQGVWYVRISGSQWTTQNWGVTGDVPVAGDFDGDGTTDFSVFRPSDTTWYVIHSSTASMHTYQFGNGSDLMAPADYDGDGKTDEAVYRPSNCTWYIHASTGGYYTESSFTASGDLPAPADYDGDGKADLAVFRPTGRSFRVKLSSTGATDTSVSLSANPTDPDWRPVSADYDGDGKADHAVYNANTGVWYIRSSVTGAFPTTPVTWGQVGDFPVHNDYDSDGKVDYAVWRPGNGTWYIVESANGYSQRTVQWGQSGDIPVPAFYRR